MTPAQIADDLTRQATRMTAMAAECRRSKEYGLGVALDRRALGRLRSACRLLDGDELHVQLYRAAKLAMRLGRLHDVARLYSRALRAGLDPGTVPTGRNFADLESKAAHYNRKLAECDRAARDRMDLASPSLSLRKRMRRNTTNAIKAEPQPDYFDQFSEDEWEDA